MTSDYDVVVLSDKERETLERAFRDLMALSECAVPSVQAAARAAVAHIAQALNGQGMAYELYTKSWQS